MRFWLVATALAAAIMPGSGSAGAAQGNGKAKGRGEPNLRFKAMDRNGDGRITRTEWRGSAQSFKVHDWNGNGVLSGEEVREGATRRQPRERGEVDFESADKEYEFDDWTPRGFEALDHDRDGRIDANEWHFDREGFRRSDDNRDGALSRAEFLGEGSGDDDRDDRYQYLDGNRDGRISRAEWHGTSARFTALDDDRNGFLTETEMYGHEPRPELFTSVDVNRDGSIAWQEWHWSQSSFDQRDSNRDGRLSREEFVGARAPFTSRNATSRAGYERGTADGRLAGKEDRGVNKWDLEGQRELEQSDAGYHVGLGPRAEYQAGYREGFRMAYREGFGR